jgi:phosphate transport system protein
MSIHFEQELENLKGKVLRMAGHAEAAVRLAMRAFEERSPELARQVKEDDAVLDAFEVEVDEISIHLLAKAPLASDLRLIAVAMKTSHDLERVGDEATTISRRARELASLSIPTPNVAIGAMATAVLKLLKGAIDSFVDNDPAKARALIPEDKKIDAVNKAIYQELAEHMVKNPNSVNACLHLMFVAKSLERIGDHATNIAEEVVYLCEALDIRHSVAAKLAASLA